MRLEMELWLNLFLVKIVTFVNVIMMGALRKNDMQQSAELNVSVAIFLENFRPQPIKIIQHMQRAAELFPGWTNRWIIFRALRGIEEGSIGSNNQLGGQGGIQSGSISLQDTKTHNLRIQLIQAQKSFDFAKAHLMRLWTLLSRRTVDVDRAMFHGCQAAFHSMQAQNIYQELLQTFSDNPNVLRQYSQLIRQIYTDSKTANDMLEEAELMEQEQIKEEQAINAHNNARLIKGVQNRSQGTQSISQVENHWLSQMDIDENKEGRDSIQGMGDIRSHKVSKHANLRIGSGVSSKNGGMTGSQESIDSRNETIMNVILILLYISLLIVIFLFVFSYIFINSDFTKAVNAAKALRQSINVAEKMCTALEFSTYTMLRILNVDRNSAAEVNSYKSIYDSGFSTLNKTLYELNDEFYQLYKWGFQKDVWKVVDIEWNQLVLNVTVPSTNYTNIIESSVYLQNLPRFMSWAEDSIVQMVADFANIGDLNPDTNRTQFVDMKRHLAPLVFNIPYLGVETMKRISIIANEDVQKYSQSGTMTVLICLAIGILALLIGLLIPMLIQIHRVSSDRKQKMRDICAVTAEDAQIMYNLLENMDDQKTGNANKDLDGENINEEEEEKQHLAQQRSEDVEKKLSSITGIIPMRVIVQLILGTLLIIIIISPFFIVAVYAMDQLVWRAGQIAMNEIRVINVIRLSAFCTIYVSDTTYHVTNDSLVITPTSVYSKVFGSNIFGTDVDELRPSIRSLNQVFASQNSKFQYGSKQADNIGDALFDSTKCKRVQGKDSFIDTIMNEETSCLLPSDIDFPESSISKAQTGAERCLDQNRMPGITYPFNGLESLLDRFQQSIEDLMTRNPEIVDNIPFNDTDFSFIIESARNDILYGLNQIGDYLMDNLDKFSSQYSTILLVLFIALSVIILILSFIFFIPLPQQLREVSSQTQWINIITQTVQKGKSIDQVVFDEELATTVNRMDAAHKQLYETMTIVGKAITDERDKCIKRRKEKEHNDSEKDDVIIASSSILQLMLDVLVWRMSTHCSDEEMLMNKLGLPSVSADQHKSDHVQIMRKLMKFHEEVLKCFKQFEDEINLIKVEQEIKKKAIQESGGEKVNLSKTIVELPTSEDCLTFFSTLQNVHLKTIDCEFALFMGEKVGQSLLDLQINLDAFEEMPSVRQFMDSSQDVSMTEKMYYDETVERIKQRSLGIMGNQMGFFNPSSLGNPILASSGN
ncbi:MAG: hypothetical protein EZS28_005571 [Streblomastix strix]|uniref:TmcB/TmcC TPR repeats domain-containing protein n=1 Tax=Streblomastix strix TaxID=222440 RepID=A0A5J4WVP9_9EUKA|nr:MAG: hypothetical protein EZS28_005571 [Streblomastix strix]